MRGTRRLSIATGVALGLAWPLHVLGSVGDGSSSAWGGRALGAPCSAVITAPTSPSTYYAIDLVPTKRVPGTGAATGTGHVAFARSPFGVALSPTGHYVYDIEMAVSRLSSQVDGEYTAWITTSSLDQIERLGPLDRDGDRFTISGQVSWNKFLLVITLEPAQAEPASTWQGPIVLRGMSRSGMMHTMAGHGPFEREPCAKYGY